MKSLLKDEYLLKKNRMTSFDYDIGILSASADHLLNGKGYDLDTDEMMCQFQGVSSCINFLATHERFGNRTPNKCERGDSSYRTRSGSDWTIYDNYDSATKAMLETPEKFRNFTEADIRLTDYDSVGNAVDFDKTGDFLDVSKFLEGEPDCFGVMREGRIQHRFCSVVVNGNARCDVDQRDIALKAARTLRVVDALEANGIRCELAVVFSNDNSHAEIIVKHYNDPLDINDFAVALSPDFFRWVTFRLTEHSATWDAGYGAARMFDAKLWTDDDADNTVYIDGLIGSGLSSFINEEFDKLEKKIKEGFSKGETYSALLGGGGGGNSWAW